MKNARNPEWPVGAFMILRFFQLICALIVIGVLSYFEFHLRQDSFGVPWEFSILDLAAVLTLINLVVNSAMFLCWRVSAVAVIVVDLLLTVLWGAAFGLLAKAMGQTITQSCSTDNWGDSDGVQVCNMFKVLFAFSFLSLFLTFVSLCIAVSVRKMQSTRGTYEATYNPNNIHDQSTSYAPLRERSSTLNAATPPRRYPSSHYSGNQEPPVAAYRDNLENNNNPFGEPTPSPHKASALQEAYEEEQHPALRADQGPYASPYHQESAYQEPTYQQPAYHRDQEFQNTPSYGQQYQQEPAYHYAEEGVPMQQHPYHQNPNYYG